MDLQNFNSFMNEDKHEFFVKFVITAALKMIRKAVWVDSDNTISPMRDVDTYCSDKGRLNINPHYKTKSTVGDIVIFFGIVPFFKKKTKLAHSTSCYKGMKLYSVKPDIMF